MCKSKSENYYEILQIDRKNYCVLKNCYVNFVMPSQSLFVNEATLALLLYLLVRGLARGGQREQCPSDPIFGGGQCPPKLYPPQKNLELANIIIMLIIQDYRFHYFMVSP